jgi:hypothetical protein
MTRRGPGYAALLQVWSGLAVAVLLLSLGGLATAARSAITTASVHISVHSDAITSTTWHGSFRAVRPAGVVVARGRVVDRPRQRLGADWFIMRKFTTGTGTLRFRISGPYRTPTSRLHWQIVGGTGAYAALQGQGLDVERVSGTTATAVMRGVPLP